jgi:hypothetical protein
MSQLFLTIVLIMVYKMPTSKLHKNFICSLIVASKKIHLYMKRNSKVSRINSGCQNGKLTLSMEYFNINESYKGGKGSLDGALSFHLLIIKNLCVMEFTCY